MALIVPGGGGVPGGGRFVIVDPESMGGMVPQRRAMMEPPPEPEKTEWQKQTERSDAVELKGEVEKKTQARIAELKALDESGEGDLYPEKGKAGFVAREESSAGLGFNSQKTTKVDAFLSFDLESGEVQEFHSRSKGDDESESVSIVRDETGTTYTSESGTWSRSATFANDGSASYEKTIRITDEMAEMMKLQMIMNMAQGGGGGSPF